MKLRGNPGAVDIQPVWGADGSVNIIGWWCVFRRDVQNLKWDTITAEAAVNIMRENSGSVGNVDAQMKDIPITCLFKTSGGGLGVMEILGVVEDERGYHDKDDKGRGMKFRYKLVLQPDQPIETAAGLQHPPLLPTKPIKQSTNIK